MNALGGSETLTAEVPATILKGGRVIDQQPVLLVDTGTLPADDKPVVDRRRPLLGEVRRDDEHARYGASLAGSVPIVPGVTAHRLAR